MIKAIAALIACYTATALFGYGIHRALHQPWAGKAYERHLTHHNTLYPITSYQSEKYRDPGGDSTVLTFAVASIPMIATPIGLAAFKVVDWKLAGVMVGEMLLFGWANDAAHDAMHIEGHWLNGFPAFRKWSALHYQHHVNTQQNFGIFGHTFDRLFGTYKDDRDTI